MWGPMKLAVFAITPMPSTRLLGCGNNDKSCHPEQHLWDLDTVISRAPGAQGSWSLCTRDLLSAREPSEELRAPCVGSGLGREQSRCGSSIPASEIYGGN